MLSESYGLKTSNASPWLDIWADISSSSMKSKFSILYLMIVHSLKDRPPTFRITNLNTYNYDKKTATNYCCVFFELNNTVCSGTSIHNRLWLQTWRSKKCHSSINQCLESLCNQRLFCFGFPQRSL